MQNTDRKVINAKTEAKWFIYEASKNKNTKFTAEFVPLEEPVMKTPVYRMKQACCLEMFCENASILLGFCLNPSIHKRYQDKIFIGGLTVEYFVSYFSRVENHVVNDPRKQFMHFNGQIITVNCPSFSFIGFDNLPSLGNKKAYHGVTWNVYTNQRVYNNTRNMYQYEPRCDVYRVRFVYLEFFCNPVTNLVFAKYEIVKEHFNYLNNCWELI